MSGADTRTSLSCAAPVWSEVALLLRVSLKLSRFYGLTVVCSFSTEPLQPPNEDMSLVKYDPTVLACLHHKGQGCHILCSFVHVHLHKKHNSSLLNRLIAFHDYFHVLL